MKKLIAILMTLMLVGFAFGAGGWHNIFNGDALTKSGVDDYLRFPCWDETNGNRVYVTPVVLKAYLNDYYTESGTVTVDTNTVVADASPATQTISLSAGELLQVIGLYPGGTWDSGDFIEFNNADSNATTLDTMHLGISAWKTEGAFDFYATQDTVIYINLGDSVSVAPTVSAKVKYEIK